MLLDALCAGELGTSLLPHVYISIFVALTDIMMPIQQALPCSARLHLRLQDSSLQHVPDYCMSIGGVCCSRLVTCVRSAGTLG